VTARDTEEAVRRLDGKGRIELAWEDVARSVYESQDKILSAIQQLHCPSGFQLDADIGDDLPRRIDHGLAPAFRAPERERHYSDPDIG